MEQIIMVNFQIGQGDDLSDATRYKMMYCLKGT